MLSALASQPRRMLLVLAALLVATALVTGSGATFTATSTNASNVFATGTLLQTNTKTGAAVLSASGLRPGGTATSDVTVKNSGTLGAAFQLVENNATNGFSAGSLKLTVADVTTPGSPITVYDSDLGGLGTKTLATFAPGASRTFRFTATLSATAPPVDQGKSARADYVWNAVPGA